MIEHLIWLLFFHPKSSWAFRFRAYSSLLNKYFRDFSPSIRAQKHSIVMKQKTWSIGFNTDWMQFLLVFLTRVFSKVICIFFFNFIWPRQSSMNIISFIAKFNANDLREKKWKSVEKLSGNKKPLHVIDRNPFKFRTTVISKAILM